MNKKIDWTNVVFLTITPILAVSLMIVVFKNHSFSWQQLILFVFYYLITGISITAGYHRLFSHRTYQTNRLIKIIFLIFGAAAFQNSALKWSADHRIHHRHVDNEEDPYNINRGFFYAHMGWIFYKEAPHAENNYPKDLLNDKLVMWQHKYYFLIAVLSGFILPVLIGHFLGSALTGFAFSGLFRLVFVHHCTFFINSLCHVVGTRPYTEDNTARDSFILAFFTYGEGYHNYHHFFPGDFRNGIRWYQFDPTKWLIFTLAVTGLAKNLKRVPEKIIQQAKEEMTLKKYVLGRSA
jgi:stearoyl-CoA desaturase (delta-9 desaturase)